MSYYRKKKKSNSLVIIDPRTIEDDKIKNSILDNAENAIITIDLDKIKDKPDLYLAVITLDLENSKDLTTISEFVDRYSEMQSSKEIDDKLNKAILSCVKGIKQKNKNSYYKMGKDIPKELIKLIPIMSQSIRPKVLEEILNKEKLFYPYARKYLISLAYELAETEKDICNILMSFYKSMDGLVFNKLVKRLPDKFENETVKKILSKTKRFNVCVYDKAEIKQDEKKRVELLKDIARTPSSVKNLDFNMSFSFNDIEKLAPVMRFNLLKWYFEGRFRLAARSYRNPSFFKRDVAKYTKTTKNITIPNFTNAELNSLLFSVGIKKNAEVTEFINMYDAYRKILRGETMSKSEASEVWGKRFRWYWY